MQKVKSTFSLMLLLLMSGFLVASFQENVIKVKANSWPIIVNTGSLDFGVVFPSENLQRTFTVSLESGYEYEVNYIITHNPKARDEDDRQYCRENPSDFEKCYPDLCEFLSENSLDGEGDIAGNAHLLNPDDALDNWAVDLVAPPIAGFIGQSYEGSAVAQAGTYGCDIGVEFLESVGGEEDEGGEITVPGDGGEISFGGGGYYPGEPAPKIDSQKVEDIQSNQVTVCWKTDKPATSRVIYDTESHPVINLNIHQPPNYGYAFSTAEDSNKIINHCITVFGLTAGQTYYYRTVSHGSPVAIAPEYRFTTLALSDDESGEVKDKVKDKDKTGAADIEEEENGEVAGMSTSVEKKLSVDDSETPDFPLSIPGAIDKIIEGAASLAGESIEVQVEEEDGKVKGDRIEGEDNERAKAQKEDEKYTAVETEKEYPSYYDYRIIIFVLILIIIALLYYVIRLRREKDRI
jgi:hypothetical protein